MGGVHLHLYSHLNFQGEDGLDIDSFRPNPYSLSPCVAMLVLNM